MESTKNRDESWLQVVREAFAQTDSSSQQMALVLRVDLGRVLAKLTQYTAHREMLMKSKTEAADEIASLRARVAKLEGALDPFATATEDIDENEPGDINMWEHPASMNVYISDFRDARQALKDTPVE